MRVPFNRPCQDLLIAGLDCSFGPLLQEKELIAVRQS